MGKTINRRQAMAATAAAVMAPRLAFAQSTYPNRVINLVVPFPPGGGTDVVGRFIAQQLGDVLPQKVIVLNRAGAGGLVGSQYVKAQPADGYTLMFTSQSIVTQTYDSQGKITDKDFIFLGVLNQDAIGLAVPQNSRWKTIKDFIDEAKKNPGALSVGNAGVGSVTQMQIPLIEKAAGIKLNAIPFAGSAGTHTAVLSGTTDAASVVVGDAASLIKEGKFRMLEIMSPTRLEGFPEIPTLRELGIAIDWTFWRGLFVHKDTPPAVVGALRQAVAKVAHSQAFKSQMTQGNFIPAAILDEAELAAFIRKEQVVVEEVIKAGK
ncbi:MAG: tripartite tricarboxylate transporter substrate binding protein [Pseudomonadota bacterium]